MEKNKKIFLLFLALVLFCNVSVYAKDVSILDPDFIELDPTAGETETVKHEADTSKWEYANGKHWNPCKVSGCTDKTHKYNEAAHGGKATCTSSAYCPTCEIYWKSALGHTGGEATCESGAICTRCGGEYTEKDPTNHTNMKWYYSETEDVGGDNSGTHWKYCDGCNTYEVESENHDYIGDDTGHHCECGKVYRWGEYHRFSDIEGTCTAYNSSCTVVLTAEAEIKTGDMPYSSEYKMIGANEQHKHVAFDEDVTVTFSVLPYVSKNDGKEGELLKQEDLYYSYAKFEHYNYQQHLELYGMTMKNDDSVATGFGVDVPEEAWENEEKYYELAERYNNEWIVSNLDKPYKEWYGPWSQFGLEYLVSAWDIKVYGEGNANGTTYKIPYPDYSGHGFIDSGCVRAEVFGTGIPFKDYVYFENWMGEFKMFCNGGCVPPPPTPIRGYLRVSYRTIDGEKFTGLPDSLETIVVRGPGASSTVTVNVQNQIPDKAGYRLVGYTLDSGILSGTDEEGHDEYEHPQLGSPGAIDINDPRLIKDELLTPTDNPKVDVELRFSHANINRRITFYYEKVNLTIRHYNLTDGTTLANGLRQITTNENITKTVTFNTDPAGKVPKYEEFVSYPTNSLSKFWWPAYNLEFTTVSKNENPDLDSSGIYRRIKFHPYKVFAPKVTNLSECASIVNSNNKLGDAIKRIYNISGSNLKIDVIDRMVNNNTSIENTKNLLKTSSNILIYARENGMEFVENKSASNFNNAAELNMITSKLVTLIEDNLLKDTDKVNQIKKTVTIPFATKNAKIDEKPGYRVDKYVNYYYSTTEIMVNNINSKTNLYMKSSPDATGTTYDLRTKVPIRDTIFRAESLITTPPAIENYQYTYSVYDHNTNSYARKGYNISGFILEKFDIKVGNEVLLTVTKEEAEEWYAIDGTTTELYPPFTEQYIIDTSATDGVAAWVSDAISQIDLNRLDKDASINFYYRDVSLLTIKYVRDTDFAEIHPSKTVILGSTPIDVSPEDLTPDYEYRDYTLDDVPGTGDIVSVAELPNGEDRILVFIYKVPELEVATPENQRQYVDLRSNDRVSANLIKQEMYPSAPSRMENEKYSDTYKSLEEYNSYNDKVRLEDQSNEGIPTLEDIYANVVTEQFLMDNALTIKPTTQKIKLKIVKKYYDTNKKDDNTTGGNNAESHIKDKVKIVTVDLDEMEIPYQYYCASGADLKIIEDAIVYNNVIEERNGSLNQTKLVPTYQKPYMNYIKNGYLHIPVDRNYNSAISGLEDFRSLDSGFYNVKNPSSRGETLTAILVLDGIDEYEPTASKLKREYQDANGLILTALQNAKTLIKPDKLTVTYNASANGQDNNWIKEFYVVTDQFNTTSTGAIDINNNMRLGRTYTADILERMKILHTSDIPLTGTDVLYKKDNLFVQSKTTNGTQGVSEIAKFAGSEFVDNTVADVKYILYQAIINDEVVGGPASTSLQSALGTEYNSRVNSAMRTQTIVGYPVVVHTPVVNASIIDLKGDNSREYSDANKHTVNPINGTNGTIVLGQKFDVSIPHDGQHINSVGYNNKDYNYKGLLANGNKSSKDKSIFNSAYDTNFAIIKQIRFDKVGVILYTKDANGISGGNYYPKNTWIDLPLEDEKYTFTIPEWEEEVWDGREVVVETRVAAENIPDKENKNYYVYNKTLSYNNLKSKYGVWKTFKYKVIGELIDLEIRATNDPAYSNYKAEGSAGMPIGQQGQANAGKAYQYAIKLGYSVYFDITSTGWTGDTTEKIEMTPNFYYVSKNGGEAKKVDLYYKMVGNKDYVKLEGAGARPLTTIMSTDAVRGSRCKSIFASWNNRRLGSGIAFFNANAGIEMSNTTRLLPILRAKDNYIKKMNKQVVNYGTKIETGNTDLIELNYNVRLAYANAVNAMKGQKYAGIDLSSIPEEYKEYCIGHWYGAFRLPSTTVAVNPGETPKPDKSNVKKDGYIIVTFENIKSEENEEKPYLKVDPDRFSQEGADKDFTLPNGKPGKTPELIPAIIYETNIAANQDAEVGGTH